jgi:hypothetical protein
LTAMQRGRTMYKNEVLGITARNSDIAVVADPTGETYTVGVRDLTCGCQGYRAGADCIHAGAVELFLENELAELDAIFA